MIRYTVKKGDSLWAIAKRFGVTVEALVASNGITNKSVIHPGQVLQIPTKNYEAIGKKVEEVVEDINNLPSFKALLNML